MTVTKKDFLKQDLNQFAQSVVRGQVTNPSYDNIFSAVVSGSTNVVAGDAVEIITTSKGTPAVKPLTSSGNVFGFAIYEAKQTEYSEGQALEIAQDGAVIYMWSSEAIDAGEYVRYDYSTGAIAAADATNDVVIGIAQEAIAADGIGKVKIMAQPRIVIPS